MNIKGICAETTNYYLFNYFKNQYFQISNHMKYIDYHTIRLTNLNN